MPCKAIVYVHFEYRICELVMHAGLRSPLMHLNMMSMVHGNQPLRMNRTFLLITNKHGMYICAKTFFRVFAVDICRL